ARQLGHRDLLEGLVRQHRDEDLEHPLEDPPAALLQRRANPTHRNDVRCRHYVTVVLLHLGRRMQAAFPLHPRRQGPRRYEKKNSCYEKRNPSPRRGGPWPALFLTSRRAGHDPPLRGVRPRTYSTS